MVRRKSHELKWLELLFNRQGLQDKELEHYHRLLRGFEGEVEFDKYFSLILDERIPLIDDLTLRYKQNTTQLDKLFSVNNTLYVVDMKNYRGHYIYDNDTWKVGQFTLSHNIFEQLRRAVRIVEAILFKANIKMTVQGVLVFMNPESKVEVRESVKEKTFMYGDTLNWLLELRNSLSHGENHEWTKVLNTFAVEGYKTKRTCSLERFDQLEKGIMCRQCGEFHIKEHKSIISCSCGYVEVKETAYVRTVCEYGLLMHDREIYIAEARKFLGGDSKDRYLKMILDKHFKLNNKASSLSSYENKGIPSDMWFKH